MSLYIDPTDPKLKDKISRLIPTSGYCIFVDIVGSTELKDKNLTKWILFIYNTFANIIGNLFMAFNPLKSIGDELMFFIPESELKGETALSIFSALCNIIKIINSNKSYLREVKIGVAYCQQAYDITFIKGTIDIYGKDIDLTSRLLSVAKSNEIIMNYEFVEQIHKKYNMIENKDQFEEVPLIVGPWPQQFKGFKKSVNIYKIII